MKTFAAPVGMTEVSKDQFYEAVGPRDIVLSCNSPRIHHMGNPKQDRGRSHIPRLEKPDPPESLLPRSRRAPTRAQSLVTQSRIPFPASRAILQRSNAMPSGLGRHCRFAAWF